MFSKCWLIIKDDTKRTFEVCGQESNVNSFSNNTHAMQKAGMNISSSTPPVTNKTASKELIKIIGYSKEDGLHQRLLQEFRTITLKSSAEW